MKNTIFIALLAFTTVVVPLGAAPAQALSCLPVDMFLKDIVGKEEVVVLSGTVNDQISETDYTGEVLSVSEVFQGYAEKEIFAYHEKSVDWGYYCNAGPAEEGAKSMYIINRDAQGKYVVAQRLSLSDDLVSTLKADLEEAEVEGSIAEITSTDRMNQIMTTINDLFKQIQILFKEYLYWKSN